MKVPSKVDHYDISDYFWIPGGSYTYKVVDQYSMEGLETVEISNTKIDEYSVILAHRKGPDKEIEEYFIQSNGKLLAIGSKDLSMLQDSQDPVFFEPPITIGANIMAIGDVFATFYKSKYVGMDTYFINKFQFIGVENVALPSGTITECLKFISEDTNGTEELLYFAKNIGLIKTQKISNNGFGKNTEVKELLYAKLGDTIVPTTIDHFCSGNWTAAENGVQVGSSTFNFVITVKNTKNTGLLIFSSDTDNTLTFSNPLAVVSEDGVNYNADPEVYGVNPPQITLTLSNGSLSGTFQIQQYGHGHGDAAEETPPVRIYTITGTCN